ncbi:hypothetical protein EAI_07286 [Harpegnathos saltator]|uniref:Uncharacterized protein n=1 Tax=Harpegnathos saltator TaxID=610380 RepID=E2BN80_HARSA|nr:hypothetical protein EAI_07286 [Harpegnathos saltator]
MSEKRLSLGINVSILLILTIFGVLLFLPLRLLFDTNYDNRDGEETNATDSERGRAPVIPIDHRKLKRCPNLPYEDHLSDATHNDHIL